MTHELVRLAERAHAHDGVAPFNEASLRAIDSGAAARVAITRRGAGHELVAAAYASGDAPVEIVVDPALRRRGHGTDVLADVLAAGETQVWAHGDLPGASVLAERTGLRAVRSLLVLRRDLAGSGRETVPIGVTIRTYVPDDAEQLIAVNARAFASHPEQGAMDAADLDQRMSAAWFDPLGLFVAERDGHLVGFHWTKVHDDEDPPLGEVYVVGVDPSAQGIGLGAALTARGLRHLAEAGLRNVILYVEADNEPALATYHRLGFTEHLRDTLYALTR
ncbi:mycothiol synthase [soil metagenome]